MNNNSITHSVILSVDPESIYGKFFEHMCTRIISKDGTAVLCLWCSEVDASRPLYLEIVSHKIATPQQLKSASLDVGLRTRIPHHLVLMISEPPLEEPQW